MIPKLLQNAAPSSWDIPSQGQKNKQTTKGRTTRECSRTMKFMRWESGWVSWLGPGYTKPVVLNPPWLIDSPGELLFLNNSPNIIKHRWDWEPPCQALKTSQRSQALQRKASRRHYQSLNWRGNGWLQLWVAFVPVPRQWENHITWPRCSPSPFSDFPTKWGNYHPMVVSFFHTNGLQVLEPSFLGSPLLPSLPRQTNSSPGWGVPATRGHCGWWAGGCQSWEGSVNYLAACLQGFSFLRKFWIQVKNQFVTVILSEPTYVSLRIAGELRQQKF